MTETQHTVQPHQEQFLIAKPRELPPDAEALNVDELEDLAPGLGRTIGDGEVVLSILADVFEEEQAKQQLQLDLLERIGDADQPTVLVVTTTPGIAKQLEAIYKKHLHVNLNDTLTLLQADPPEIVPGPELWLESEWNSGLVPLEGVTVDIRVKGKTDDQPVHGATVYLLGSLWFAKDMTDQNGRVKLTLHGETKETLRGLMVKPRDKYWSLRYNKPDVNVTPGEENLVQLRSLKEHPTLAGFPQTEVYGWGQEAMKLGQAKEYTGKDIKIAIIDSGLGTMHDDLKLQVPEGRDFTGGTTDTWNQDSVGHGSHVAGVIAGLQNEAGIRGFAPEAEIYVFKVFPGGKYSDLIKSLTRCIENQVHVVNLSLGGKTESQILHEKLQDARDAGVACIAAAGNSKGPVLYPAKFPEVLAVAAIGKTGTFPDDSYHARQVGEHSSGGYFTARFTCFGAEVDICAPGVAVVSSVPTGPSGYASWDGTSMACPHVVGLAALVLQAHDDIRSKTGSARVEALFQHLKDNTEELPEIDEAYRGAGLPDAVKALGKDVGIPEKPLKKVLDHLEQAIKIVRKQAEG